MRILLVLLMGMMCSVSFGQRLDPRFGWVYPTFDPYCATAGQAARVGHARQMRAFGMMLNNVARARRWNQAAYKAWLHNDKERVKQYWEKKIIALENRMKIEKKIAEIKEAKKQANLEYFRNRRPVLIEMLHSSEYDAKTGKIIWPYLLRTPKFAAHRRAIESLLRIKAAELGDGDAIYETVRIIIKSQYKFSALDQLKELLQYRQDPKTGRSLVSPDAYLSAKKFLIRLLNTMNPANYNDSNEI